MLPYPGQKVYNATKTALNYLTEGFRHELAHAGLNIKVTVSHREKNKIQNRDSTNIYEIRGQLLFEFFV